MKTSIKALLAVVAMGASALFVQAQPALKVVTVDLGKALQSYYKTNDEQAKLQAFQQDADQKIEAVIKEGRAMADKFKEAQETLSNPVINDDAKKKAQAEAQNLYSAIQKKEQDINEFRQQAIRYIQQGVATSRQTLLTEISNVATEVGKKKGATLIVERNAFVYGDAAYDITDEVIAQLNKGHPTPAPTGTTTGSNAPAVSFPGAK